MHGNRIKMIDQILKYGEERLYVLDARIQTHKGLDDDEIDACCTLIGEVQSALTQVQRSLTREKAQLRYNWDSQR